MFLCPFSLIFPSFATTLLSKAKHRLEKLKTILGAWLSLYLESLSCPHMVDSQPYFLLVPRDRIAVVGHYCEAAVLPWLYFSITLIPRTVWTTGHLPLELGTLEPRKNEWPDWGHTAAFCLGRTGTRTQDSRLLKVFPLPLYDSNYMILWTTYTHTQFKPERRTRSRRNSLLVFYPGLWVSKTRAGASGTWRQMECWVCRAEMADPEIIAV